MKQHELNLTVERIGESVYGQLGKEVNESSSLLEELQSELPKQDELVKTLTLEYESIQSDIKTMNDSREDESKRLEKKIEHAKEAINIDDVDSVMMELLAGKS